MKKTLRYYAYILCLHISMESEKSAQETVTSINDLIYIMQIRRKLC